MRIFLRCPFPFIKKAFTSHVRSTFSYVCIACVNCENSISVAMGNGNDRVKAAAEYVTGDHNDAGMGAALHRFVLTKATTKL